MYDNVHESPIFPVLLINGTKRGKNHSEVANYPGRSIDISESPTGMSVIFEETVKSPVESMTLVCSMEGGCQINWLTVRRGQACIGDETRGEKLLTRCRTKMGCVVHWKFPFQPGRTRFARTKLKFSKLENAVQVLLIERKQNIFYVHEQDRMRNTI